MATRATKLHTCLLTFRPCLLQFSQLHSSLSQALEETIKAAIAAKDYQQIPEVLSSFKETCRNANPFSCLSFTSANHRTKIIHEMMQSFNGLRPRSRPQFAYNCLLTYTLQNPHPFPISLSILQRSLRSGCTLVLQMRLLLSSAWIEQRQQSKSVADLFWEMRSIGYNPDTGTCNYLISSLCAVDELAEAVNVLKGMGKVGCIPTLESYGSVVGAMSVIRTNDAVETMKEMVVKGGLMPRQETVVKVAAAMRANRDVFKAVEMIEFLEGEGYSVAFESYELVLEGCLYSREYILAGKVVMGMTERGFIPYIKARQKVVEGLASVGEWKLASVVRQRFAGLRS